MLIARGHNISIGNKPFNEKLQSYQNSPMLQHREIKEFANGENGIKPLLLSATKNYKNLS